MNPTDCLEIVRILWGDLDKAEKIFKIIEKNYRPYVSVKPDILKDLDKFKNPYPHGPLMNDVDTYKWHDYDRLVPNQNIEYVPPPKGNATKTLQ